MRPVTELPPGYEASGTVDLSKNKWLAVAANAGALVLFFLFGWLFVAAAFAIRPGWTAPDLQINGLGQLLAFVAILFGLMAVQVVLHELAHGLFFQFFTGARPRYGFKGLYAYAAAPDWYLPRNQHLVVGLAPLVLITAAGFILLLFIPGPLVPALLFMMVTNAAGAVGDMIVVVWLLFQPASALVRDTGDAITVYRKMQ